MEVDDILSNSGSEQKKSGAKGKRHELQVVKLLNKRFSKLLCENSDWGHFSRSAGSGNRWGQVAHLPKHARDTYGGDITCPDRFAFVIECKGGYNEIDLVSAFGGHKELDAFLQQSEDDASRTGRKPMLVWKKDRKPRLAFVKTTDLPDRRHWEYWYVYRNWTAVRLTDLLECADSYFFPTQA